MSITITYTDGVKSRLNCVIELYQPNNSDQLLILDDVGHRMEVDKRIIKKIEVKPMIIDNDTIIELKLNILKQAITDLEILAGVPP